MWCSAVGWQRVLRQRMMLVTRTDAHFTAAPTDWQGAAEATDRSTQAATIYMRTLGKVYSSSLSLSLRETASVCGFGIRIHIRGAFCCPCFISPPFVYKLEFTISSFSLVMVNGSSEQQLSYAWAVLLRAQWWSVLMQLRKLWALAGLAS